MARSFAIIFALVALAVVVTIAPGVESRVSCGTVTLSLSKCISYATEKGPISPGCCDVVKSLNTAASIRADRQTTCGCLKKLSSSVTGIMYGAVASVPSKCGISISYTISPSTESGLHISTT